MFGYGQPQTLPAPQTCNNETLCFCVCARCLDEVDLLSGGLYSFKPACESCVEMSCDMHECLLCTSESLLWGRRVDPWSWASFSWRLFSVSGVSCTLGWPGPSDEQSWNEADMGKKNVDAFKDERHVLTSDRATQTKVSKLANSFSSHLSLSSSSPLSYSDSSSLDISISSAGKGG